MTASPYVVAAAARRHGLPSLVVRWAAAALVLTGPLATGPAAAETLRLDLPAALELARTHSRDVADADGAAGAAEARAKATRGEMLPQVRLNARYTRLSDVEPGVIQLPAMLPGAEAPPAVQLGEKIEEQTSLRASVEQPLFAGGALWNRWQSERSRAAAASAQAEAARTDEDAAATEAFLSLLKAQSARRAAARQAEAMRRLLADADALHAAGRLSDLDRWQVAAKAAGAEARLAGVSAAEAAADAALRQRVGIDSQVELELTPPDAPATVTAPFEDWYAVATASQPALAAARHGADAARSAVRASRSTWLPRVALAAGWTLANPNERHFPVRAEFNDTWDASVVASWDLWRSGADHYRSQAAAFEAENAARRVARAEDAVALGLRTLLAVGPAREAEVAAARAALEAASQAAVAARALFDGGRSSTSDLLTAEAALEAAESRLIEAEAGRVRVWADLMRLTGGQMPTAVP
jgi:outer membrane protein TolC